MRRRAAIRRLDAGRIYSETTNGTPTQTLIDRNIGTVYSSTTLVASGAADTTTSIYFLNGNGLTLTLPDAGGQSTGRWLRVVAPGTTCSVASAVSNQIVNGGTALSTLDISQGTAEFVVVGGVYRVITRYVP